MIRWIPALLILLFTCAPLHASEFKWMDEDGATYSLKSLQGQPVLVHFWASWCPSCRAEMPAYARWVKKHPEIKILTISLDQKAEHASAFLKKKEINLPILLSDENQARKLGAQALPTTILLDANGKISQHHRGPRDWDSSAYSEQLLKSLRPEGQSLPLHSQL